MQLNLPERTAVNTVISPDASRAATEPPTGSLDSLLDASAYEELIG